MTHWLRFFLTWMKCYFRKETSIEEERSLTMRIWPQEAELNFVSHAKLLILFEMGRWDFIWKTGWSALIYGRKETPLAGSLLAKYFIPLKRNQKLEFKTKIIGWDEKYTFFLQRAFLGDQLAALLILKVITVGTKGRTTPESYMRELGHPGFPELNGRFIHDYSEVEKLIPNLEI